MKKLVNTPLSNTIWYATINEKNGTMSTSTRVDVTDSAVQAVADHFILMDEFRKDGFFGYEYDNKDKTNTLTLCAFDNRHLVVSKKIYDELLEYKRKYEDLCK